MYALVREVSRKPGHDVGEQEREEAEAIQARMAGSLGQLTVAIGDNRFIRIAVWTSTEDRAANLNSEDHRRIIAYWSQMNDTLIGEGEVVSNTLLKG